jgi:hypothetical protein
MNADGEIRFGLKSAIDFVAYGAESAGRRAL